MPERAVLPDTFRQDLVDQRVAILAEGLWKTYEMGGEKLHALCGINLTIHRGEYVAIMGPSGSGKSTMMNLPPSGIRKSDLCFKRSICCLAPPRCTPSSSP